MCGNVVIEVPDQFDFMGYCHCTECKKLSGSDYAIVGGISSDKFRILQGHAFIKYYHKNAETDVAFCCECGASLFNHKIKLNRHNIRVGILDSFPSQKPMFHIFVASKAPWEMINDNLPQYSGHISKDGNND